jgi:hypothetical protein
MRRPDLILTVRRPPGAARVHRLAAPSITIGRDPGCTVPLHDPAVAPVHAVIERTPDGAALRLATGEIRPLRAGDALTVGPFRVDVAFDEPGLTSDRLDTERRARMLVRDLHAARARDWAVGASVAAPASVADPPVWTPLERTALAVILAALLAAGAVVASAL